jgi:hypothetical protein
MVRALLANRKSQTRRVLKPQPVERRYCLSCGAGPRENMKCEHPECGPFENKWTDFYLRYVVGDRLWVRESFSGPWGLTGKPPMTWARYKDPHFGMPPIWYWADGNPEDGDWTKPKPPIHMPRWASRLTLTVTGVRVERLQDISEGDAIAEGATVDAVISAGFALRDPEMSPQACFRALWASINGTGAWEANPFVAVCAFDIRKGNIDE